MANAEGTVNKEKFYRSIFVEFCGFGPEKTREVTRPGQAGLSKIMSLSAVPAWRVTRSEGNPQARATHEPGQKVVGLL